MPVDNRRINAPEDTISYHLYTTSSKEQQALELNKIIQNGKRLDDRQFSDNRKTFMKTGVVTQAKGSAYLEQGETKVIVSVFDPREIPNRTDYSQNGELYCEFKFAPFSCPKRRMHQQDSEEKLYSELMKKALESAVCRHEFPNFQVDVFALILHNDGSAVSAAITAAGLALAHAGVPMYDLITSVTIGVQNDKKFIDPTLIEENFCEVPQNDDNHGLIIMSILSSQEQVSQFYQSGYLYLQDLNEVMDSGCKACAILNPLVQKTLVKYVIKNVEQNVDNK